jgi:hypothetical protein
LVSEAVGAQSPSVVTRLRSFDHQTAGPTQHVELFGHDRVLPDTPSPKARSQTEGGVAYVPVGLYKPPPCGDHADAARCNAALATLGRIFYYLDIVIKGEDDPHARHIVQALGEKRDGKGYCDPRQIEYVDVDDRNAIAWKFEYIEFEDRVAALKALAVDLDRVDGQWRDCLIIG